MEFCVENDGSVGATQRVRLHCVEVLVDRLGSDQKDGWLSYSAMSLARRQTPAVEQSALDQVAAFAAAETDHAGLAAACALSESPALPVGALERVKVPSSELAVAVESVEIVEHTWCAAGPAGSSSTEDERPLAIICTSGAGMDWQTTRSMSDFETLRAYLTSWDLERYCVNAIFLRISLNGNAERMENCPQK